MSDVLRPILKKEIRMAISKDNIETLRRMEHARPIDSKNVAGIVALLKSGKHFETPMAVNDVSTDTRAHYRIIDGNHRLVAIERVIDENPDFKIMVVWEIYDHLSEAEEREAYDLWNSGKTQSVADRIHVNQKDFPLYQMMQKYFPAPVVLYGLKEKQRGFLFQVLARAYIHRLEPTYLRVRTRDFLEMAKSLGEDAYEFLKVFATDFSSAFGDPTRANPFNRRNAIEVLMRVYAVNLAAETLTRDEIVNRWRSRVANNSTVRNELSVASLSGMNAVGRLIVEAMNRSYFRHLAITPEEFHRKTEAEKKAKARLMRAEKDQTVHAERV